MIFTSIYIQYGLHQGIPVFVSPKYMRAPNLAQLIIQLLIWKVRLNLM